MIALTLALAACLVLALVLSLVLALTLPRRVARLVAERAFDEAGDLPAQRQPADRDPPAERPEAFRDPPAERPRAFRDPTATDLAIVTASLRALLHELGSSQEGGVPPQTPPVSSSPLSSGVETTRRIEPSRGPIPDRPPASRERPTPRAVTPPGSARVLPPEPGIVAAHLGPRPDAAWSRHRSEAPQHLTAPTMPSMPAVQAASPRERPPAIACHGAPSPLPRRPSDDDAS